MFEDAKYDLMNKARGIARTYMSSGDDMTDQIVKLAEMRNLNEHQIHRLAEFSNRDVRQAMYRDKNVDQDTVTFPLADAKAAIDRIKVKKGPDVMPDLSDYKGPPVRTHKMAALSKSAGLVITPPAEDAPGEEKRARIEFEKKSEAFAQAKRNLIYGATRYNETLNKLSHVITQDIRNAPYGDQQKVAERIAREARIVDDGSLFYKVAEKLEDKSPRDAEKFIGEITGIMDKRIKILKVEPNTAFVRVYKDLAEASKNAREFARIAKDRFEAIEGTLVNQKKAGLFGTLMNLMWIKGAHDESKAKTKVHDDVMDASNAGKAVYINQVSNPLGEQPVGVTDKQWKDIVGKDFGEKTKPSDGTYGESFNRMIGKR